MNKPKRKIFRSVLSLASIPMILTGCTTDKCNVDRIHVHKYLGKVDRGYKGKDPYHIVVNYFVGDESRRVDSQKVEEEWDSNGHYSTNITYDWTTETFDITLDDEEFYKTKGYLFNAKDGDNWYYLHSIMSTKRDYLEYKTEYGAWTMDPNHSTNTGEVRIRHMKYFGYRIVYKDGKYIREKSPLADDIREILDEYPYFSPNCYESVYKYFTFSKEQLPYLNMNEFDDFKQPDFDNWNYYKMKRSS